jgi:hypothetical protein
MPETLANQEKTGFSYDASFGSNQFVSFRGGTCFPFTPWNFKEERKFSILEIPLVAQDKALVRENESCLEKSLDYCKRLIDLIRIHNGVFTVLWHACVSKLSRAYLTSSYHTIIQYASRYNPWFTNCITLANWWKLRNEVTIEAKERGDSKLEFDVMSPKNYDGFSINLYLPKHSREVKIFVEGDQLPKNQIVINENSLLFSFKLSKGFNKVIVELVE